MTMKGNKKLSKESRAYLEERVGAMERACNELRAFMADDPEEGDEESKENDKPNVGEESGTDENSRQPDPSKQYVIEIVEKAPTTSDKK